MAHSGGSYGTLPGAAFGAVLAAAAGVPLDLRLAGDGTVTLLLSTLGSATGFAAVRRRAGGEGCDEPRPDPSKPGPFTPGEKPSADAMQGAAVAAWAGWAAAWLILLALLPGAEPAAMGRSMIPMAALMGGMLGPMLLPPHLLRTRP